MSWLDLHMHSSVSADAHHTPEELMDFCLAAGVRTAAVADHNKTAGVRAAQKRAAVTGVTLIPATELDCLFDGTELHVLGYWIDPEDPTLLRIGEDVHRQEVQNSAVRIKKIQEYGIFVNEDEVMRRARDGIVPGELICDVALEDARNRGNPLLQDYIPGGRFGDNAPIQFALNLCNQGKVAHVATKFISLSQAVAAINGAGGIAVLAHPGYNVGQNSGMLQGIAAQGVCGLEAYSSYHTLEDTHFFCQMADALGLAISCGSDFHGRNKPKIQIGCVDCEGRETELLQSLFSKRASQRKEY